MATFKRRISAFETGSIQVQISKGGAVIGEGKKRRAYVMKKTRKRQLFGVEGSAGAILGFQHQHAPAMPSQGCRRHQPIGPRSHHDRVPIFAQEPSAAGSQSLICRCTSSHDNWIWAT